LPAATFAEFLREQLAPLGRTVRRMFGKAGVFCDGVTFGMVTEKTLPKTGLNPSNVLAGRSFAGLGLQGANRRPVPALLVLAPVGIPEQH
jgi:hypothetical protein